MLITNRCTVCHDKIERGTSMICGDCGQQIHDRCETFERQYNCPECAEDLAIGVVEF